MLIACEKCHTTVRVPDDAAGRKGRCPQCGFVMDIPAQAETGYAAQPLPPPLPSGPPPLPKPDRREDGGEPRRGYGREDDDEDEDLFDRAARSIRRRGGRSGSIGLSMTGMVMGLTSLVFLVGTITLGTAVPAIAQDPGVCCFSIFGGYTGLILSGVVGILGCIFSFVGMRRGGLGYAWTGAISSILTLVVVVLILVLTVLFGVVVFMGCVLVAGAAANANPPQGGPPRRR